MGGLQTLEIVDKDHYIYLPSPEKLPFVNGETVVTINSSKWAIINIADYTQFRVTFSAATNMTLYFVKSDGSGVQSYGASSFPAQPLDITAYSYCWIYGNAGDRNLTFTLS